METLTPAEVAYRLGMSVDEVLCRIARGELSAVIPVEEFERFRDALHAQMIRATADEIEADLRDHEG